MSATQSPLTQEQGLDRAVQLQCPRCAAHMAGCFCDRCGFGLRQAHYRKTYGTASDSIQSLEYLTSARLDALAREFGIQWDIHTPWYGLEWTMRPLVAKIRGRRKPSRFRIYSTRKIA